MVTEHWKQPNVLKINSLKSNLPEDKFVKLSYFWALTFPVLPLTVIYANSWLNAVLCFLYSAPTSLYDPDLTSASAFLKDRDNIFMDLVLLFVSDNASVNHTISGISYLSSIFQKIAHWWCHSLTRKDPLPLLQLLINYTTCMFQKSLLTL